MSILETSASMGLIVAAPTAGSAGIVPGLLLALQETYDFSDNDIIRVLFNAGPSAVLPCATLLLPALWAAVRQRSESPRNGRFCRSRTDAGYCAAMP